MQAPRYAKSLIAGGASAFLALGLASVGLAEGASAPSTLRESFTSKTAAQQKFFGTAETVKVSTAREAGAPSSAEGVRSTMTRLPSTPAYKKTGAWHKTLRGDDTVREMELFTDEATGAVAGVYQLGCALCGHRGLIHGGIIAMGFDDLFGTCYFRKRPRVDHANNYGPGFTANLDVNYRRPMPCDRGEVVFVAKIDRVEGRKVWLSGEAYSADGKVKFADSTALFIATRKRPQPPPTTG